MAVVAQAERKMISARTKAALVAATARGVRLVKPENLPNREAGQARGRPPQARRAEERARDLAPVIAAAKADGAVSLRQVAAALNARGISAAGGNMVGRADPEGAYPGMRFRVLRISGALVSLPASYRLPFATS